MISSSIFSTITIFCLRFIFFVKDQNPLFDEMREKWTLFCRGRLHCCWRETSCFFLNNGQRSLHLWIHDSEHRILKRKPKEFLGWIQECVRGFVASIMLTLRTFLNSPPAPSPFTFKRRLWNNERQRLHSHSTIKTNMKPVCQDINTAMSRCNSILDGYLASTAVEGAGGVGLGGQTDG